MMMPAPHRGSTFASCRSDQITEPSCFLVPSRCSAPAFVCCARAGRLLTVRSPLWTDSNRPPIPRLELRAPDERVIAADRVNADAGHRGVGKRVEVLHRAPGKPARANNRLGKGHWIGPATSTGSSISMLPLSRRSTRCPA